MIKLRDIVDNVHVVLAGAALAVVFYFVAVDTFSKGERLTLENVSHYDSNGSVIDILTFNNGMRSESFCPGKNKPNHPYRGQIYRRSPYFEIIHPVGK